MLSREKRSNIGILQGRVIPNDISKLQVYPTNWKREFIAIKDLGFDFIELLDDKKGKLRELLQIGANEYFTEIKNCGLNVFSICLDRLCNFSLLKRKETFCKEIDLLFEHLKNVKDIILVIPFFDNNHIITIEELEKSIEYLAEYEKLLKKQNKYFSLEFDIDAKTILSVISKFNFSNIGICYDLGNSIGNKFNLREEILLLKNYINHVHVKDKLNGENIRLRKNSKQLKDGFDTLIEIGYTGSLSLETCIKPNPLKEAEHNLLTVKNYYKLS